MTEGVGQLGRLTYRTVDGIRSCPVGTKSGDTFSGIVQADCPFTMLTAGFTG